MTDVLNREQRLDYERRILAAEVEWVSLAKFALRFCELMERNTKTLDAALCLANARAEREKYDRLIVEPWAPILLALKEKITQNDLFPEESDNQNRLLSEKQPKSVVRNTRASVREKARALLAKLAQNQPGQSHD
jgi:hypothetical protein